MRHIKRRINSINSIQQITRAMEMVAASKLRRAQQRVNSSRPFTQGLSQVLAQLVASEASSYGQRALGDLHPLLALREGDKVCYLVVTSDQGLAGGFNTNITRYVERKLAENPSSSLAIVGRVGRDYFAHRGVERVGEWVQLGDEPSTTVARVISDRLVSGYLAEEFDEIRLVYTVAKSAISQELVDEQLLPIDVEKVTASQPEADWRKEYIYEPSTREIFDHIFPRYVENVIYRALVESKASELAARRTAMRNASDNAQEMIDELTISFNRARQAGITTEISEIVGGAEALKG